ncbi:DeoR/GlpR family DNA-binding transcription regulator [Paenibacillus elgii]|uniref:DeoR/GlpR family DNA-binding transcription regulator n=1 Tax=Paenibacillus elgii TaxID=189691 RepID=UPI000FD731AF|nr:DeoR/GlpR family DNA-binding transcription regulator [Paenibacillus elgii]NEN82318.1 DeoR/GlpR transcriptional regulator [Paenibacillus elgii]
MSLTFEERKKTIMGQLLQDEKVQVHALAEQLNVSPETIRRDLDRLEKEGLLKKVYGGAVKARMDSWEPPFIQREQMNNGAKTSIGKLAASLVKEGETIMIDNGTTTMEIVRHLQNRPDVTVVTHSVPVLLLAMELFKGRIIFAGGAVNVNQQSVGGTLTEAMLQQFKVHKAFISVGGISLVEGITDYDLNEASVSRKMIERAEESIVLADHSKFGKTTFANIAALQDISMIITDRECPADWIHQLREKGIEIFMAED